MTVPTKWPVHPVKTQISLGIRPVWSVFSLYAGWVAKDQGFFMGTAKTDQTWWMPRLIWVIAGHTGHFCWFVMRRLKCDHSIFYLFQAQLLHSLVHQVLVGPTLKTVLILDQMGTGSCFPHHHLWCTTRLSMEPGPGENYSGNGQSLYKTLLIIRWATIWQNR